MISQTHRLDVVPGGVTAVVHVKQYQTGESLVFELFSRFGDFEISAEYTECTVRGTKSDGNGYSANATCDPSNNSVTVELTEQMTAVAGRQPYEITITESTGRMITTTFILDVHRAALDADTVVSESVIKEVQTIVEEYIEDHPGLFVVDPTLTQSGEAADAKVTGDAIADLQSAINSLELGIDEDDGLLYLYVDGVKQGEGVDVSTGTRYTITYNLDTNMVSSNTARKVSENASYITTISSSNADYQINDIAVSMGGINITTTVVDGNVINIPSVTGDVTITVTALFYPSVVTDNAALTIQSGGTGTIGVKLHAQPTQNQTVSLHSDGLTLSANNLTFTTSNWNTYQYVTVTANSVDDTTYEYITFTNSDPLLTESTVMVTVKELGYSDLVDTTIPTAGMHTVTADDFTSTSVYGNYIRLNGYNAEYTNIKIPSTIDGKIPWLTCDTGTYPNSSSFSGVTTIQYVTLEDGVIYRGAGTTSGCNAANLFGGCTSLLGVSNMNTDTTNLSSTFSGCTSLKFVDNLNELVNLTASYNAFLNCTSLDYVQDLSSWTNTGLERTFRGCTSLKKIFGLPQPSTSAKFDYAFMQTQIEKVTFPENTSSLIYALSGNTHVNHVEILANGLSTTNLNAIFGTSQSQNINVYANPNSTTLASLQSMFASSTKVTVNTIGGGSLPSIVVWGDSTSSPNRSWIEWPARLQTKLGTSEYLVKNEAVSGEYTTSTSARQGGNAIRTNAFEIPATQTASNVILTTADNQTFSSNPIFSAGGSFNPCKISGVDGIISRNGADYYFTRLEDGTAVSVSSGATVVSDNDTIFNASGNIMLVNIGHNAGWNGNAGTLVNQMQLMVNHFLALGGTDYIISGPWSGTWITTDSGWAITQEVASLASTAFGNHWLDLPADMAANAQTDNPGWTPTSEDLANMELGKTPMSLTYDNVHPTEYGAQSQMMAFYRKGVLLGYWS